MRGQLPPDSARAMRWSAGLLLAAMAALFLISHPLAAHNQAWAYTHAFAEAAMVGGIADWFAVTALFRRPLGLPIPHTAIIPANKNRIAASMAQFLRENFLTAAVVARRLRGFDFAASAGRYLAAPKEGARHSITSAFAALSIELLQSLDTERLGLQMRAGLSRLIGKLDIAPLLGRMLAGGIADGKHRALVDSIIRWVGITLEDNEDEVRALISAKANAFLRYTGLDTRLANSVLDGLYRLLAEVLVDTNHPLRTKLDERLSQLAHDLQHDADLCRRVEEAKRAMLANPALADWWIGVWERIRLSLIDMAKKGEGDGLAEIKGALSDLGARLQQDARLQHQINRLSRRTLVGVTARYGDEIVSLVSETVKRWDAQTLNKRLEQAVGRDLQFIRINGTIVGGLVGLLIHAVKQVL